MLIISKAAFWIKHYTAFLSCSLRTTNAIYETLCIKKKNKKKTSARQNSSIYCNIIYTNKYI